MKKLLPLLLLIIVGCQPEQSGTPIVVASATKMKVLYVGIDNPISIAVSGISFDKIIVKVDDSLGTVTGDSGKYIARVKSLNYKLFVYKKEGDKEIFLDTLKYKILQIPSPPASILGHSDDSEMSREELLTAEKVTAQLTDFIFDLKFPIVSYSMAVKVGDMYMDAPNNNETITERMKELIKQSKVGDKVLIESVYVQAPEGKRKIPGILIRLK